MRKSYMTGGLRLLFCTPLLIGSGCTKAKGPPPPPTYAVTGEVRHADGQPVVQGLVQFFSESDPSLNISAPVKNGKFTLSTNFGNQVAAGTMEGRYRVSVTPAFDPRGAPIVVRLPEVYEIKSQDNHFVLKVP